MATNTRALKDHWKCTPCLRIQIFSIHEIFIGIHTDFPDFPKHGSWASSMSKCVLTSSKTWLAFNHFGNKPSLEGMVVAVVALAFADRNWAKKKFQANSMVISGT